MSEQKIREVYSKYSKKVITCIFKKFHEDVFKQMTEEELTDFIANVANTINNKQALEIIDLCISIERQHRKLFKKHKKMPTLTAIRVGSLKKNIIRKV